ncbi:transposon TX1 uncharacterized 149 kDa protein isoform X1 [Ictalurus punctatus]|uniref:Transposon TX1 uncharacterized 149 kDa protein isoform X1 n=1 Tax=Ictalurus punctatus TaxID=7998 RepID=A0A9F7TF98_ICTPU|nr:transposon TX1 uncharacterized 149 kDa protein isoform X1 [Ictalurus punctatus]
MVFLDKLDNVIADCNTADTLILGGDFNCTTDDLDRNHTEPHVASRKRLWEMMEAHELIDIWRNLNRNQKQYTWAHSIDNTLSLARLDRFYGFKHQLTLFTKCFIVPVGLSDHSMVQCIVSKENVKPKSAYWHFNTALLEDTNFRESFIYFWNVFKYEKMAFSSIQQWWDVAKAQIKAFCQQYTLNVTRDIVRSLKALETGIVELQCLETTGDRGQVEALKSKKAIMNDLLGITAQGALVRSRFKSMNEMDAPSTFFFGLEQKNGQKRFIHAVRTESGDLLSDPAEIRKQTVSFYSKLYSSEQSGAQTVEESFLKDLPKLSEHVASDLDMELTLAELHEALQGMENGRAPGIDGLPVEFYKAFWTVIGQDVLEVLLGSVKGGELPLSCRRAVLTLLPKKGDLTHLKNWRPVSLLCTDYKLLSKALASRLTKVMEQITHLDQTYCVPGRSILDNIHLIRDILDVSRLLGLKTGLIFLDQEKAFDRVEHEYLWKVLETFGFNPGFIAMIKTLYSEIESVLKVNGGLCAPFRVYRGIRQGCSLSGMLYTLEFEPLLCKLRNQLSGFKISQSSASLCLSAYADDLVVMLGTQTDVTILIDVLKDFEILSSAKVKWVKSEAILVGEWGGGQPTLPAGLAWKEGGFKYLGVYLGSTEFLNKNWEDVVEKIKGRLNRWKWLVPKMSYRGRTLVINNLAASTLWHKLACVDPPPNLLSNIQALLVDFFWDKLHWIPQSVLHLPKEEGGQGLIHIASRTATFRLQFIQRLLTGPERLVWRAAAYRLLHTVGGLGLDRTLFLMDTKTLDLAGLPVFYSGLFKIWTFFKKQIKGCRTPYWLLEEPLVNGGRLDISGVTTPSLSRVLVSSGIVTLRQLVNIAGTDLSRAEDLAASLGLRSLRIVNKLLHCWRSTLTSEERAQLMNNETSKTGPIEEEPFPQLGIAPDLDGCGGPLLEFNSDMNIETVTGKLLYKACVKVLNKKKLNGRVDTPWRVVLGFNDVKPEWRALYKPPLTKKCADLQWRILYGIVSVNSFISILNPEVTQECPFCSQRETVFHAFIHCSRLQPLFVFLKNNLRSFYVDFTFQIFIFGFKYVRKNRFKCQLINFIFGQAKMSIYLSRKNKVAQNTDCDARKILSRLIKSRILIDFNFYNSMGDVEMFKAVWCCEEALCSVVEGELCFTPALG